MIPAKIAGAIILGVPLIVLALVGLRRQPRPVFWFALVLIVVGLGYLMATGATDDIARSIAPAPALQPAS
jgi:dipeptide/tripeptide permease